VTRKAPTGKAHASCLDHVPHAYTRSGWLCVTTNREDVAWPHAAAVTLPIRDVGGSPYEGPTMPAGRPQWVEVDRAADMVAFADHLAAVAAAHRAVELARRDVPALTAADYAIEDAVPGHPGAVMRRYPLPAGAAFAGLSHLPWGRPAAVEPAPVPAPVRKLARKPSPAVRASRRRELAAIMPAPVVEPAAVDYAAADAFVADGHDMHDRDAVAGTLARARAAEPVEPEPVEPEPAPIVRGRGRRQCPVHGRAGLATCDTCGDAWPVEDMTAGEYSAARHDALYPAAPEPEPEPEPEPVAVEPEPAPVVEPEPEPAPVVEPAVWHCEPCDRDYPAPVVSHAIYHVTTAADVVATNRAAMLAYLAETAPAAPILTAVPAPEPAPATDGRPTCDRCGQTFRKAGAGLAWHNANRPDCAPVAPVLAAVQ
jgi:hypothetical protein